MGKEAFLINPRHQCHLSQWGEWVHGAQSRKERRLLCEFVFIPIHKRALILKNVRKRCVFIKPKHHCHLSQ